MSETALEIAYACWVSADTEFRAARAQKELADRTESFKSLRPDIDARYAKARTEVARTFAIAMREAIR